MRWKTPQVGDERVVRKFLWWPIDVNGESRWLERVTVRQVYIRAENGAESWRWAEILDDSSGKHAESTEDEQESFPIPIAISPDAHGHYASIDPTQRVRVVKTSRALQDHSTLEMLVAMGPKAVPILLRMEQTELPVIHPIVKKIGTDVAVPAIIEALDDRATSVREMAAILLGCSYLLPHASHATGALIEAASDEDASVRRAALQALVVLADARLTVPVLIEALRDADVTVRTLAASSLEHFGDMAKAAAPALTEALNDGYDCVRKAAASALTAISSDPNSRDSEAVV
jgi:hypothetical protein